MRASASDMVLIPCLWLLLGRKGVERRVNLLFSSAISKGVPELIEAKEGVGFLGLCDSSLMSLSIFILTTNR